MIQRVLEHCDEELKKPILDEIIKAATQLSEDQYANYVVQHLLAHGSTEHRDAVVQHLKENVVALCQHKYASNVVEKCLLYGVTAQRHVLIQEILGEEFERAQKAAAMAGTDRLVQSDTRSSALTKLVQDPFGNYVVQKILEVRRPRV